MPPEPGGLPIALLCTRSDRRVPDNRHQSVTRAVLFDIAGGREIELSSGRSGGI